MRFGWLAVLAGCSYAPVAALGDATPVDGRSDSTIAPDTTPDTPQGARRKAITIHGNQVTGSHTDFPVYIALVDPDLAAARPDGHDILFTDATSQPLDHELERWDRATTTLHAWVRLPVLPSSDTTIYIVYGDDARAVPQAPAGVFQASFAAVWHLEDTLAAAQIAEATATHPGTATLLAPTAHVDGQLGSGIAFDGQTGSSIAFVNMLTGSMSHTMTAWVSQLSVTQGSSIVSVGTANNSQARFFYGHRSAAAGPGPVAVGFGGDDLFLNGTDIEDAGWTMLAWTFDGTTRRSHVYANGVELTAVSGSQSSNTVATQGATGLIGLGLPGFTFAPMKGILDEVRIATVVRSPQWIATEFANQSSPSTFYTVGNEEPAP